MNLQLVVLSLRYSSWSIRPWLALTHAGVAFTTKTVELSSLGQDEPSDDAEYRKQSGSVTGLYPVLWVDDTPIHESLAICEWVNEHAPEAGLWPDEGLARARARAISCEMASDFTRIRNELTCHVFGRAPGYQPSDATSKQVRRVFELWEDCLTRSGGPYLFGRFGIADCMYFPMLTRFVSYDVKLPDALTRYAATLLEAPAVQKLLETAKSAPAIPHYDAAFRKLGGDPDAALRG